MAHPKSPYLSVALPVWNGAALLLETLEEIDSFVRTYEHDCEVVVVDDGSTDRSPEILERFANGHPYVQIIRHNRNLGKGAALKTAAAASRGEILLTMDSDATYAIGEIRPFLSAIEDGSAAAIGNRRDKETRFVLHPRDFAYIGWRHLAGGAFRLLVRLLTGLPVRDTQCGFKCYRGELARKLFPLVQAERFAFDVEILALLHVRGHRISQLPVVYHYANQPSSVSMVRDGARAITHLVRVGAKIRRIRRSGSFADATNPEYQHRARTEGNPIQRFWHQKKLPLVTEQLNLERSDRVLDVGGGSSEISLQLASGSAFTLATDLAVGPLSFLKSKHKHGPNGLTLFVAADGRTLPCRDASFDKLVCLEVIEHLPDSEVPRMMAEWRRVLAPGGRLVLSTPNYRSVWPVLEWLIDRFGGAAQMKGAQHLSRFTGGKLNSALVDCGFRVDRMGSVYHLSPFLAPIAPKTADALFRREMRSGGRLGPILYAVAEVPAE